MAVALFRLTHHAAQQQFHQHLCGMSLEIHSEDTPAATAAYHKKMKMHVQVEAWRSSPDLSLGVPKCLAWRSPPDLSLGAPDQDGIQGYLKEQFHTTAAHAAEECGHLGIVDVLGADSRTELLYVQSALLARTWFPKPLPLEAWLDRA